MRPHSDERPLPRQVGMKLVLQVDEGGVGELVEGDAAEDGRGKVGSDGCRLLAGIGAGQQGRGGSPSKGGRTEGWT